MYIIVLMDWISEITLELTSLEKVLIEFIIIIFIV
jgi:hypothetical protein